MKDKKNFEFCKNVVLLLIYMITINCKNCKMSSVSFTILKDESSDVTYRLKVEWFPESFHILILVEKSAFEGTV